MGKRKGKGRTGGGKATAPGRGRGGGIANAPGRGRDNSGSLATLLGINVSQ
jgi:hypothetical protein